MPRRIGALVPATASLPLLILPGNGTADEETVQAAAGARSGGHPALRRDHPDDGRLPRPRGSRRGDPGPLHRRRLRWRPRSGAPQHPGQGAAADAVGHLDRRHVRARRLAGRPGPADHRPEPDGGHGQRGDGPLVGRRHPDPAADRDTAWPGPASTATPRTPAAASSTGAQLDAARRLDEQYDTYADLLVEPKTALAEAAIALPRSVSLSWRGDADRLAALHVDRRGLPERDPVRARSRSASRRS